MLGSGGGFKRIYPDSEAIVFDGGKDNKFPPALIPENESPDCANVVFFDGGVETREGSVKVNTTPAGSVSFDGLYTRRARDLSETMCAFIGGHMMTLGTTTFITVPSAQSVFTIGQNVGVDFTENYMFIGNGGAGPYKWDGTNFTLHGVVAPTLTATVASNGVGAISASAQINYGYTFVNSALVEGNLSPIAATFTISSTSGQNTVSNIQTAPASFGVLRRRLYRSSDGGANYLRVTELADNTTTTYNDNIPFASLGVRAPTDNGVPPLYNAIFYHRGYLFVNDPANPNHVWYSVAGQPYTFSALNFFLVGDNTTDLVKGFAGYDNHLVIFCEESIWINYMSDPSTPSGWRQLKTNSPFGSRSPYCLIDYQNQGRNEVLFPAIQNRKFVGFGSLAGLALDPTSTLLTVTNAGSLLQTDRIEPDMFQVQESFLSNITGIVFKNKAYLTLTFGSAATQNNRVYLFDFSISNMKKNQKNSWVPFTGWNAKQFTVYGGKLYFCSSTTSGFVYQAEGTGVYSDDGGAIDSYFYTKEFPGFEEDINYYKDFRYANLLVDKAGTYFMNLGYRADSDKGAGQSQQINLNPGGSLWGTMIWGTDIWGGGNNQSEIRVYIGPTRGKRIQFKFSNQKVAGQRFKVHRMNFAYNLKGYR